MPSKELEITNKLGLHARAAARLVQLASRFESEISVENNGKTVNAKSIMGIMMLAASKGSRIIVTTGGPDAGEALTEIETLIRGRFGEDE